MSQTQEIELINPAKATKYLEAMRPYRGVPSDKDNRKVRQAQVDFFCNLLRNGRFRLTPQGIAFDEEGWFVDGQHRMWAIIETGISARMWVARGLTAEEVLALDQGAVRSVADVAHYDGANTDPIVWTVTKYLVRGVTQANVKVPYEVLKGWLDFYEDGVDFSVKIRGLCQPTQRKLTAPMMTAFARAYYGADEATLLRFAEIVSTGQRGADADSAATVYRDAWLTKRLGSGTDQYFKTCAAIRAFVDRRKIKTLQRAEVEVWDLPKMPKELIFKTISTANSPRSGIGARNAFAQRERA